MNINDNPYIKPEAELKNLEPTTLKPKMTSAQKAFNIICLIWGLFTIMGIMSMNMVAVDSPKPEIFHFIMGIMAMQVIILLSTSILNLVKNSFITATTIIQIVFIFLGGWTIPVAIWGIVLLVKKNKRQRQENEIYSNSKDNQESHNSLAEA